MTGQRLPGGNLGGAVRIGNTVRKDAGPWTRSVAALLRHLEAGGFERAPRFLGIAGETVDILLDVSNPGLWMAHCHIAEHAESGMMFSFRVAR